MTRNNWPGGCEQIDEEEVKKEKKKKITIMTVRDDIDPWFMFPIQQFPIKRDNDWLDHKIHLKMSENNL